MEENPQRWGSVRAVRTLAMAGLVWVGVSLAQPRDTTPEPEPAAPPRSAPPLERWEPWDAGSGFGAGVTDRVAVGSGRSISIALPRSAILTICDDTSVLDVVGVRELLQLTGKRPGRTLCGFWFEERPVPNRLFEVTVQAAAADAGARDGG